MGEMIQRKFREMLDSVSNASDEFVNKYFSNDSVDLDIDVSGDTEEITEEDVETIKGDTDDWFDYKGNIVNDLEEIFDKNEVVSDETLNEDTKEETIEEPKAEEEPFIEDKNEIKEVNINIVKDLLEDNSNEEIESELKKNVTSSAIEKEIVKTSIDNINEDDYKEEIIETVKDTQYKKLSGDELIDLLNSTDNGEDFFNEIEV